MFVFFGYVPDTQLLAGKKKKNFFTFLGELGNYKAIKKKLPIFFLYLPDNILGLQRLEVIIEAGRGGHNLKV